jgi:UDP-N-acetyl-D-mannosaminuronic acid dehydrogenase
VNIHEARTLMNAHPRVNLLTPGIGVGGHCIAVDPWFFAELAPDQTPLIQAARRVNDDMPAYWAAKILQDVAHLNHRPVRIAMLGMSYKPNVGDCRESPALQLKTLLKAAGAQVVAYDPWVAEYSVQTLEETVQDADYLAVCVLHEAFLSLREPESLHALQVRMRTPLVRWLVTPS